MKVDCLRAESALDKSNDEKWFEIDFLKNAHENNSKHVFVAANGVVLSEQKQLIANPISNKDSQAVKESYFHERNIGDRTLVSKVTKVDGHLTETYVCPKMSPEEALLFEKDWISLWKPTIEEDLTAATDITFVGNSSTLDNTGNTTLEAEEERKKSPMNLSKHKEQFNHQSTLTDSYEEITTHSTSHSKICKRKEQNFSQIIEKNSGKVLLLLVVNFIATVLTVLLCFCPANIKHYAIEKIKEALHYRWGLPDGGIRLLSSKAKAIYEKSSEIFDRIGAFAGWTWRFSRCLGKCLFPDWLTCASTCIKTTLLEEKPICIKIFGWTCCWVWIVRLATLFQ